VSDFSRLSPEDVRAVQVDTLRRYANHLAALVYRGVNQQVNDDLTYLSRATLRNADALASGSWELPE
jgi:hypothetical protein